MSFQTARERGLTAGPSEPLRTPWEESEEVETSHELPQGKPLNPITDGLRETTHHRNQNRNQAHLLSLQQLFTIHLFFFCISFVGVLSFRRPQL